MNLFLSLAMHRKIRFRFAEKDETGTGDINNAHGRTSMRGAGQKSQRI